MRRKFLASILALCMIMSLLPMTAFAADTGTASTTPTFDKTTVALGAANATTVEFTLTTKDITYTEGTATVKVYSAATGDDVAVAVTGAIGENNSLTLTYDSDKDTEEAGFPDTYYITIDEDGEEAQEKTESARVALTVEEFEETSPSKTEPVASDFTFTAPTSLEYNGSAKTATVVPAAGKTGMGEVTIEYYNAAGQKVPSAINAGKYTVKINVTEGDSYQAKDGLTDNTWNFTITQVELTPVVTLSGAISNEYNGDKNLSAADLAKLNVTFEDSGNNAVTVNSSDYTVTASYADANAETDKAITVTVALKEGTDAKTNYTLADGGVVTGSDIKGTITKKEIESSASVYLKIGSSTTATVDLSKVPGLPSGESFSFTADDNESLTGFTGDVSTSTLTLTSNNSGNEGDSSTYMVTGTGTNYVVEITVTVTLTSKEIKEITATVGADLTYNDGETVAGIVTNGPAIDGETSATFTTTYEGIGNTNYPASTTAPVNAGTYKVTFALSGDSNFVADPLVKEFEIKAKNISTATITFGKTSYPYDAAGVKPTDVTVKIGEKTLLSDTDYTLSYGENKTAGTNAGSVTVNGQGNYTGTATGNFTIDKKAASVPANASVKVGETATIEVETDGTITLTDLTDTQKATATATLDQATKTITVTGVAVGSIDLTVKADAGTNYTELGETTVKVTVTSGSSTPGGSGGGSGTTPTPPPVEPDPNPPSTGEDVTQTVTPDISEGTASATVDKETADKLVSDAVDNKSENVTVKVDVPADADVNEVKADIPASAVADLASKTNAALTVDTPVGNVTIPNKTLAQLGGTSGNVTVTAAVNEDNSVKVEVQANGSTVGALNGGMKVDLPVSQPTAGTVAVLVDAEGNETILPKSAVDGSEVAVLLENGSATIKFVDNAQSFADTDNHWAKNSIAFVSSRNLFQGMENSSFKADVPMNRAMLVTVLHRLESTPAASGGSFDDVPSDSYYATAAAWAAGKGIVTGDDSGFSGDRSVTREEMAVMLYRYVQTINGNKGTLGSYSGMGGANDVSGWASEAMRWAVGSGIIGGDNSGNLNPGSTATRGEVSQMLMNFVKLITK